MSGAIHVFYYRDDYGTLHGPFDWADATRLISTGAIRPETPVSLGGIAGWREARDVPGFAEMFAAAAGSRPSGYLQSDLGVWGYFGRALLIVIGALLVIPAPWTGVMFYRYLVTHVALPGGRRLTFTGRVRDIWFAFLLIALIGIIPQFYEPAAALTSLINVGLTAMVYRWVCQNCGSEDRSLSIRYDGGFWSLVGWQLLFLLSCITIVGWAWVMKYIMRWNCEKVSGTHRFAFDGSGISILWRTLLFGVTCVLIVPIPWMGRWYTAWLISQIRVEPA